MASIPPFPDKVDIYRPFGAAVPTYTNVDARVVPAFIKGRGATATTNYLACTHWVDFPIGTDVRDGCSRGAGIVIESYSDGDELHASLNGKTFVLVTVWVEVRYANTPAAFKRAWCVRDHVNW